MSHPGPTLLQGTRAALSLCLAVAGCGGGDGLAQRPEEEPEDVGDTSPITVGTELAYAFATVYRPENVSTSETQSAGYLCLGVSEVRDTATAAYASAAETLVVGDAHVRGMGSDGDISIKLAGAATTDGAAVDAELQVLWLKHLLVPSRGHGMTAPTPVTFRTRAAPRPPDQELAKLPFFDVRPDDDLSWFGWDGYDPQVEAPVNFLNQLYGYFLEPPFGADFFTNGRDMRRSQSWNPTCDGYTAQSACEAGGCTWVFDGTGSGGDCLSVYKVDLVWRETLAAAPAELGTAVVHKLRLEYTAAGVLRYAFEVIVPDADPTSPVPALDRCTGGGPCATAFVDSGDTSALGACGF